MRYCGTDGIRKITTESADVIRKVAEGHASEVEPRDLKWFWSAETTDPSEFIKLLNGSSDPDRLSSDPTKTI